ncbi:hypothetical protein [Agrobacterium burrii]
MSPTVQWVQRLHRLISNMRASQQPVEYPAKRVVELVGAPNVKVLNAELTKLIGAGKLDAIYRIRSQQTGAGIAEYHSIMEIPDRLFDDTSDTYQDVVLGRDVETVYRARQ